MPILITERAKCNTGNCKKIFIIDATINKIKPTDKNCPNFEKFLFVLFPIADIAKNATAVQPPAIAIILPPFAICKACCKICDNITPINKVNPNRK